MRGFAFGALAPVFECFSAVDVGGDVGVVEGVARGAVGEDVAATGFVFEALDAVGDGTVVFEEGGFGVVLTLDQCAVDEDFAGFGGMDRPVVNDPGGEEFEAEEGDALAGFNLCVVGVPLGFGIGFLDEVAGGFFDPLRFDAGDAAGVEARGVDELLGDDPLWFCGKELGAWEDVELESARPGVFVFVVELADGTE